jgi:hypothetical protein
LIVVENPADGGAVVHDHLVLLGKRFDGDGREARTLLATLGLTDAREHGLLDLAQRRTFRRICTLAWLSFSSIGLAASRRKCLAQYR